MTPENSWKKKSRMESLSKGLKSAFHQKGDVYVDGMLVGVRDGRGTSPPFLMVRDQIG